MLICPTKKSPTKGPVILLTVLVNVLLLRQIITLIDGVVTHIHVSNDRADAYVFCHENTIYTNINLTWGICVLDPISCIKLFCPLPNYAVCIRLNWEKSIKGTYN